MRLQGRLLSETLATGALPASTRFDLRPARAIKVGVASGAPRPDGFVLWTRLAPDPLSANPSTPGGMTGGDVPVDYEIAADEGMRDIVCPMYDQAYSALVEDLAQRGMLDTTLVCNLAEFGLTPRINPAGGRDHWPLCFTVGFGPSESFGNGIGIKITPIRKMVDHRLHESHAREPAATCPG